MGILGAYDAITDMRILPLGAYDAILGMDWLKKHGDMNCNWEKKTLKFNHNGKEVLLQGIQSSTPTALAEVHIDQVLKWTKGNDVWALALVEEGSTDNNQSVPPEIQTV